jgi:hypothetical protein
MVPSRVVKDVEVKLGLEQEEAENNEIDNQTFFTLLQLIENSCIFP